jgi:hypothetical protein
MSFARLLVGAGLFAFGYYLGRQSGRMEALQGEFQAFEDLEPANKADIDVPPREESVKTP